MFNSFILVPTLGHNQATVAPSGTSQTETEFSRKSRRWPSSLGTGPLTHFPAHKTELKFSFQTHTRKSISLWRNFGSTQVFWLQDCKARILLANRNAIKHLSRRALYLGGSTRQLPVLFSFQKNFSRHVCALERNHKAVTSSRQEAGIVSYKYGGLERLQVS